MIKLCIVFGHYNSHSDLQFTILKYTNSKEKYAHIPMVINVFVSSRYCQEMLTK